MNRKEYLLKILLLINSCFYFATTGNCQQKLSDMRLSPSLEANSEKWKVKENNKLFGGIHKPEFGPYTILIAEKLDSPVIKKKTKEGAELELKLGYDAEVETGHNADLDVNRKVTTEKTKFYRLQLTNNIDTSESLFSVLSTLVEQKQTFLGRVLSNKDEGKDKVLNYSIDAKGIIATTVDPIPWTFFYTTGHIDSTFSGATTRPTTSGYLKNQYDSVHLELIVDTSIITFKELFSSKRDTIINYYRKGFAIVNEKGDQLAALQFSGVDQKRYIWIRKELENSDRQAIATFLAIILAI